MQQSNECTVPSEPAKAHSSGSDSCGVPWDSFVGCWQGVGWVLVVRQTSMGAGRRELHSEENDLTPPAFLWGLTAGGGIKLPGISRKERGWSQGSSIH